MSNLIFFDTKSCEASSKLPAWRSALCKVYYELDVAAAADIALDRRAARRSFGPIHISALDSTSCRIARRRRAIVNDKIERFSVVFPTRGTLEWRVGRHEVKTDVGTYFLLNSGEEFEVDHGEDAALIALSAPCTLLRERVRGIDDMHSKAHAAGGMSASIVRHFVEAAMMKGVVAENQRVEALCLSMLELLLQRR